MKSKTGIVRYERVDVHGLVNKREKSEAEMTRFWKGLSQ